jgi:hypothetical protein
MLVHVVISQEISLPIYSSETYSTLGEGLISQLYPIKKIRRKNFITGICFHSATCCVLGIFCFLLLQMRFFFLGFKYKMEYFNVFFF